MGGLIMVARSLLTVGSQVSWTGRPPGTVLFHDTSDLIDRPLKDAVDHDVVGHGPARLLLLVGLGQAPGDQRLVVTPTPQAFLLHLARRRHHEDDDRRRVAPPHLGRALNVDLQQEVVAGSGFRHGSAIKVAEHLGPLEEPPGPGMGFEGRAVDELVGGVGLTRAGRAGRP